MNIIKRTGTANTTYWPGRPKTYIAIHFAATLTSKKGTAANVAVWFAQERAQASADFICDDVETVQYNGDLDNRYCWAVGGGRYNTKGGQLYGTAYNCNVISIEICSSNRTGKMQNANDGSWYFTDAVLDRAVELVRYLMDKYNIPADHVIRHYDVNGKPCPGIIGWNADTGSEDAWNKFKSRLTAAESEDEDMVRYNTVAELPKTYRKDIQKLIDLGYLKGKGGPDKLDLTEDMARVLIINGRMQGVL